MSSTIALSNSVAQVGHFLEAEELLRRLNANPKHGLTAAQVAQLQRKHGRNELPAEEGTPLWKLVLEQFEDLLVRILLAAAIISFVLAWFEESEDKTTAFVEPLVILLILIANAIVGVWQESNAEAAIEALKKFEAHEAVVLRDNTLSTIPAAELVPGDIVEIAVGKMVPADIRLLSLESTTFRVDQSILTGEAESVMKYPCVIRQERIELQAKINVIFSGTNVTYGKAHGVVVATGKDTAIGEIQKHVASTEEESTPLKKKLDEFGELLSKVITVICVLVWVVNIGHFTDPEHGSMLRGAIYYFKIAVALAVAAIPEGLPAVVTTCLALGTRKMAKKNAIVRSLPSVETLGCTTVICSDKTGTLTTNMMSVAKILILGQFNPVLQQAELLEYDVEDTMFEPVGQVCQTGTGQVIDHPAASPAFQEIAQVCALCNDSSLHYNNQTKQTSRIGEATEAALRVLTEKIGLPDVNQHIKLASLDPNTRVLACNAYWQSLFTRDATLEFSRDRKSMSVYCTSHQTGRRVLFVKGAPERILERCDFVKLNDTSSIPLTPAIRAQIEDKILRFGNGQNTLRCLGLAVLDNAPQLDAQELSNPENFINIEQHLTFVGLVGMLDPPRQNVKQAILTCKSAGIRVIVITGDNKATAEAICRRIGVFSNVDDLTGLSYTGNDFDNMTEEQQNEAVRNASLFSRTEPSHKMRLVELLQRQGEVVAMTGDGVNDSPALKKADIGVAMGSGTDVAKGASKMVLADDNFSTIVAAVEEGRAIFNNTKQFIRYLISSNIGEVVCIFLTAALGMPEALVPVQLLWVNLVTDGLPATALGFNPPDPNIMKQKPRDSKEPIVNGWLFFRYLVIGTYVGLATVLGFVWWYMFYTGGPQISLYDLTHFHKCSEGVHSYSCSIFRDPVPSTISLSILVVIEMFNALNALSEDSSLFVVFPWSNMWLIGAITLSLTLHAGILYIPFFASIFGTAPLNSAEWMSVLMFSFPVIIIDEILKLLSRSLTKKVTAAHKKQR